MKINKSIILAAATISIIGLSCPGIVQAESIDSKIANEEQKIKDLSSKKASADSSLADLEAKISNLTAETDSLLNEKNKLEKEVNELTEEIKVLEEKIEKRNEKIEDQARSTQINQDKQDIVNVLLDSESISDAIGRTFAYTKLVTANNDIMLAQKEDQENLSNKKISVEEKVAEVTEKATVLQAKQAELEASKVAQIQLANEILKSLDDAKNKKSEFVAQKAEAERIAAEAARKAKEIEEQQKAAQKAAADAQKAFEEQQKATQKQAEDNLEVKTPSLSKETGEKGTTDNSNGSSNNGGASYSDGFIRPLNSFTITSTFGPRVDPTGFAGDYHDGIDLAAPGGTPIMASRAGTVVASEYHYSAGNHVIIQHDNGYYTYYMHMNAPGIAAGSSVSAGDVIGRVGTTGSSTGDHLHFGISTGLWGGFMNPAPFIGL